MDVDLNVFFNPSSIALAGITENPTKPQRYMASNLFEQGFPGRIFLVNPRLKEAFGRKVYPDLKSLPEPVDLAMLVVPPHAVPDMINQCGFRGIRGVIIGGGGFAEKGPDGRALMDDVLGAASKYGIRIMGPNSIGVTNPPARFSTSFIDSPLPRPGPVSLIMQTGLVGGPLLHWLDNISKTACLGNRSDLDADEILAFLTDDPHTGVIGVHSEGFNNPKAFIQAAQKARQAGKPVVLLKAGRSEQGARIAMSHTASMSSNDQILMAAAKQAGTIPVEDLDEFFDAIKVMASYTPNGRPFGVSVVSISGAALVMAGDACSKLGLNIAPASGNESCVPGQALYDIGSWSGELKIEELFHDSVRLALSQQEVTHCLVFMAPTPVLFNFDPARVFGKLKDEFPDKSILTVVSGHRTMAAAWADELEKAGIPVISSMSGALKGVARHQNWLQRK